MYKERALEIAKELRESDIHIPELEAELCEIAGLAKEWQEADGEAFEDVLCMAQDKLGVLI